MSDKKYLTVNVDPTNALKIDSTPVKCLFVGGPKNGQTHECSAKFVKLATYGEAKMPDIAPPVYLHTYIRDRYILRYLGYEEIKQ